MISSSISNKAKGFFVLLLLYLALILWCTVFGRSIGLYSPQFELFWSYKKWFAGNWDLGREILDNIGMFVPFGFLLAACLSSQKNRCAKVLIGAFLFSGFIEILQYELLRGLFEFDDIFNNTLGAVLGCTIFRWLQKLIPGKYVEPALFLFGSLFVVFGMITGIQISGARKETYANIPGSICFQLDKANLCGDRIVFDGFAFYFKRPSPDFLFVLKSTKTGKVIKPDITYGLLRQDVNSYFRCSSDFSKTGFNAVATGINFNEEYEIVVQWNRFASFPVGVYVTGTDIHYSKQSEFVFPDVAGTDLEEIVTKGCLRVYRPDFACYVYQYKGYLYWLADQSFHFKNNGKTYIQYQLWTTQIDKLPQKRLKNHWYWDNIGGYFENYEITGSLNCGHYRVCRRKLPEEYSITSIVTGYHENGKWIWQNYFRPVYEF